MNFSRTRRGDPTHAAKDGGAVRSADPEELLRCATDRDGGDPVRLTIRELLQHWGADRRTPETVAQIQSDLQKRNLTVVPSFNDGWIDSTVELRSCGDTSGALKGPVAPDEPLVAPSASRYTEGSLKIGALEAANRGVFAVSSADPIDYAISEMTHHEYSQLAVVESGVLKGAVSERSIMQATVRDRLETVADAQIGVRDVPADTPVLELVDEINAKGYVFVCDDKRPRGIVTTADVSGEFVFRHTPVVTIGSIELRVRGRVLETIDRKDLEPYIEKWKRDRADAAPSLGAYAKLLEGPLWPKLGWGMSHEYFLRMIKKVANVRNELLHFVTDPPSQEDIDEIERFAKTLFRLT